MDLYIYYKKRISEFDEKEKECIKKDKKLPFYRLLVFTVGIILFYFSIKLSILILVAELLIFLIIFFMIVKIDNRNSAKIKELQLLKMLNENELKYLDGLYPFINDGNKYKNETHPYSNDLDIFGNSSLFHYVNRTTLSKSSDILSEWLLFPANIEEIKDRNDAVIELSKNIEWRQKIFILGYSLENMENSINNLISWVKKTDKFSFNNRYIMLCNILSSMTIISFYLSYIFSTFYIPAILICIHFFIIRKSNNIVKYSHVQVTKNSKILETYASILKEIENEQFCSKKLNNLKEQLKSDKYIASKEIKKLSKIVNSFDIRYNILVHGFLNTIFFWDIRQVNKLEKWKKTNQKLEEWFHCVGEFEALSSFANLHFNNPSWCFPQIVENHFFWEAKNLGHPLISSKSRVSNNLSINSKGKILILTGSNMSGKSTFLRSIGVNSILSMAGSCVCATDFMFSPVRILSSMRISDSLKDNTSSFYAELKKLETIVKEVNKNRKVFFLLDEPLRGTNSIDKHIGTAALIKQFILNDAVGIIATHDLSLTEMNKEFPDNIENYNFNIKINNEELYFDYLLNKGVCTSLNASILMKKIGINI